MTVMVAVGNCCGSKHHFVQQHATTAKQTRSRDGQYVSRTFWSGVRKGRHPHGRLLLVLLHGRIRRRRLLVEGRHAPSKSSLIRSSQKLAIKHQKYIHNYRKGIHIGYHQHKQLKHCFSITFISIAQNRKRLLCICTMKPNDVFETKRHCKHTNNMTR